MDLCMQVGSVLMCGTGRLGVSNRDVDPKPTTTIRRKASILSYMSYIRLQFRYHVIAKIQLVFVFLFL